MCLDLANVKKNRSDRDMSGRCMLLQSKTETWDRHWCCMLCYDKGKWWRDPWCVLFWNFKKASMGHWCCRLLCSCCLMAVRWSTKDKHWCCMLLRHKSECQIVYPGESCSNRAVRCPFTAATLNESSVSTEILMKPSQNPSQHNHVNLNVDYLTWQSQKMPYMYSLKKKEKKKEQRRYCEGFYHWQLVGHLNTKQPSPMTFYASQPPLPPTYHYDRKNTGRVVAKVNRFVWANKVQWIKGGARHPDGHHAQCQACHLAWQCKDPSPHQAHATTQHWVSKSTQDSKHCWHPHQDTQDGLRDPLCHGIGWVRETIQNEQMKSDSNQQQRGIEYCTEKSSTMSKKI